MSIPMLKPKIAFSCIPPCSLYAANKEGGYDHPTHRLLFYGTLTELLSCQQHRMTDCAILHPTPPALPKYIDADPVTGFYDFYWFISNDPYTSSENDLQWASDIGYFNMPTLTPTPTATP
jgi:hypothetical protein